MEQSFLQSRGFDQCCDVSTTSVCEINQHSSFYQHRHIEELEKEEITQAELTEALHMNGLNDIKEIDYALLESNGKISIIKKQ